MKDIRYKATSEANSGMTFVMASDSPDRHGDINVASALRLTEFENNPVVLLSHDHSSMPVGIWTNLRKLKGQLLGDLQLAAPGTSSQADLVRGLIAQKILRGVSVGFRVLRAEAIEEDTRGVRYLEADLLEASLVSVPANPQAIMVAKSLGATNADIGLIFAPSADVDSETEITAQQMRLAEVKKRSSLAIINASRRIRSTS